MPAENTFRLILIAGFAALICVGLSYRLRADTGEKLDRRQEGLFILISLRLVALVAFAGMLAYMIEPASMAWSSVPIPMWLRWAGVATAVVSFVLKTWTFHALGKNITDTVVTRREHSLVTSGPYRWIRHPFYTSFAMDIAGVSLLTANWFVLGAGAAAFLLIVLRTRIEEQNLLARFGAEYREYRAKTGRFLPRLGM